MPHGSAFLSTKSQLWVQTSHKTLGGLDVHPAMFGQGGSLRVHLVHRWASAHVSRCRLILAANHYVGILQCRATKMSNNINVEHSLHPTPALSDRFRKHQQKKKKIIILQEWISWSSLFFYVTPLVMTSSGFSLHNTCHSMWWREPSHHPLVPSGSCQRYNRVLTWGLMKTPC